MSAPRPRSFLAVLPALLVLALAAATAFTLLGSFSTVQEAAKRELGLGDAAMGVLQGVTVAVPLVLFALPIGILVDRVSRVRLLALLSLTWSAGTLLTGLAGGFATLFVARMMTAVGMAGAVTAALSLAADLCPPAQRGRAALIVTMGKVSGQAAGFALTGWLFARVAGGWLGDAAPWRQTHYALAAMAALLIVPLLRLREPPRREREATASAPFRTVLAEAWARRRFLAPLFLGQVTIVMADASAMIWAAPVLTRDHGLAPGDFAGWMGLLILGTGVLGAVLGGTAADLGQRSARRGGLLVGAVIASAVGVPAALFPISASVPGFAAAFGTLMLCGNVTGLIVSVALTVFLPNELRGLCIGAFLAAAGLIGFGVTPTLVTAVSALLGGEARLGAALAIVGTSVSLIGCGGFWLAMRRAPVRQALT